jgi:hypothetical protein
MGRRSEDAETLHRSKVDEERKARPEREEETALDAIQRLRMERRLALLFFGLFLAAAWVLSFLAGPPLDTPIGDSVFPEAVHSEAVP